MLRVRGVPKDEALTRVFGGALTASVRRGETRSLPPYARKVANPDWVRYSSRFYERRWVVPVLAAAVDPWLGVRGLRAVSLLGYVLLAPVLLLLVRMFFPLGLAAPAVAIVLLLAPLRFWAASPLTDSWGLLLEAGALAAGCLVLARGVRWLPAWALAIVVLSFTRDSTALVVAGALAAVVVRRDRTAVALAVTGVVCAVPAPLLLGAPLREAMAYTLNGYYPVPRPTWSFVLDHYAGGAKTLVKQDLRYLARHLVDAGALVTGFVSLVLVGARASGLRAFVWTAAAASLGYVFLLPNDTQFRLELVVVPFVAIGLAALGAAVGEPRRRYALRP